MLAKNTEIALFPLNTVLFPGMMLPLHIFEERYKTMIRACLADGTAFGVVLAKDTHYAKAGYVTEDTFTEFHRIGTTARITAIEHLKDGRMNLIAVGQDRFTIRDYYSGIDNFLVGHVDPFPIESKLNDPKIAQLTDQLRDIVHRYINHLAQVSGEDLSDAKIPKDPKALAFLAGTAIQGPSWANRSDKQQLLSTQSLQTLIVETTKILDKEDKILAYMLRAHNIHKRVERPAFVDFSLN